jgi:2-polyprenyl-3-methyl-5-hydroxy-6-metoxy-1,4-benzoquinol methylase
MRPLECNRKGGFEIMIALSGRTDSASRDASQLTWFASELQSRYPVLGKTVSAYLTQLADEPSFFRHTEGLVRGAFQLGKAVGFSAGEVLDAYVEFCFTFLREQEDFLHTGQYRNASRGFEAVRQEVYENDEYMTQYMLGHYLSCAVFPHHYRQYRFFMERFVPAVSAQARLFEFGLGHGLWATSFLAQSPERSGLACDISPTCVRLAPHCLALHGIAPERCSITQDDAVRCDLNGETFDAMIASGLLEHIEDPEGFLRRIRPHLRAKTGRLFTMVPTNTAHPDHLVLFTHVREIQELFQRAGYETVEEQIVSAGMLTRPAATDRAPTLHLGIFAPAA